VCLVRGFGADLGRSVRFFTEAVCGHIKMKGLNVYVAIHGRDWINVETISQDAALRTLPLQRPRPPVRTSNKVFDLLCRRRWN